MTVDDATSDGTAIAGIDDTPAVGTLTFAPGVQAQAIVVPILNNALDAPNPTVHVALSRPVGARLGTPATTVITIGDN